MKKVYRQESNPNYWDRRWEETGSDKSQFANTNIYPIKYAELVMDDKSTATLEIGCGGGRVLKHYYYQGFNITGVERSEIAVTNAKLSDHELPVKIGDAINLTFPDNSYDTVMAFGVYHNIEDISDIKTALSECSRVLKDQGKFCISIRPNNWEMNLNEWYWNRLGNKVSSSKPKKPEFHRIMFSETEFKDILAEQSLHTTTVHRARNVSILYRLKALAIYNSSESSNRSQGYKLNLIGKILDKLLVTLFPNQFCNVLVFIGTKTA